MSMDRIAQYNCRGLLIVTLKRNHILVDVKRYPFPNNIGPAECVYQRSACTSGVRAPAECVRQRSACASGANIVSIIGLSGVRAPAEPT